jgi:stage III sporulation protein AF
MAFILNWMKDVVLFVLFASFVEYILPEHPIQAYVKLVLRVVVLLSLLAPLLQFLHSQPEKQFNWVNHEGGDTMPSLSQILDRGSSLSKSERE